VRVHDVCADVAKKAGQPKNSSGHPAGWGQTIDWYSSGSESWRQCAGMLQAHHSRVDARAVCVRHQIEDDTFESAHIERGDDVND
jgi:hypothetical protein